LCAFDRGVESFEKREKDVKRGKNKEKSMCMDVDVNPAPHAKHTASRTS
jgi:hypothetical protein